MSLEILGVEARYGSPLFKSREPGKANLDIASRCDNPYLVILLQKTWRLF